MAMGRLLDLVSRSGLDGGSERSASVGDTVLAGFERAQNAARRMQLASQRLHESEITHPTDSLTLQTLSSCLQLAAPDDGHCGISGHAAATANCTTTNRAKRDCNCNLQTAITTGPRAITRSARRTCPRVMQLAATSSSRLQTLRWFAKHAVSRWLHTRWLQLQSGDRAGSENMLARVARRRLLSRSCTRAQQTAATCN